MESLNNVISLINKHHNVEFVVEEVIFDNYYRAFRLKRRKRIKMFVFKTKVVDEYETNCLQSRINFKTTSDIESYLKIQFSDPEGFLTSVNELKSQENEKN
jgi:hypothetical protein